MKDSEACRTRVSAVSGPNSGSKCMLPSSNSPYARVQCLGEPYEPLSISRL